MKKINYHNISLYIITISVVFFNILIILFPNDIINASKDGLLLWFNNVIPSLLPFIIASNILIGLGFVSFLGVLLEKPMKKFFGVSGEGVFAWVMGLISGYPIGAKVTTDLLNSGQITKAEANRLITFTNNSGPLFILGFVGTTLFNDTKKGVYVLFCHYMASFLTGMLFGRLGERDSSESKTEKYILKRAIKNLISARRRDGRPLGKILGDSVKNSMETITVIGGFIILFSVITKILYIFNLDNPILSGFLEITNGCRDICEKGSITIKELAMCAGIISWGGLSIHAQTISFLSKSEIKPSKYILGKLINAFLAAALALFFQRALI